MTGTRKWISDNISPLRSSLPAGDRRLCTFKRSQRLNRILLGRATSGLQVESFSGAESSCHNCYSRCRLDRRTLSLGELELIPELKSGSVHGLFQQAQLRLHGCLLQPTPASLCSCLQTSCLESIRSGNCAEAWQSGNRSSATRRKRRRRLDELRLAALSDILSR